jgi:SET domain-containing protein
MICVKTCVGNSATNNLGLFAAEDIHEGTLIWKFDNSTCLLLSTKQIDVLGDSHKDNLTSSINHFGCPHPRGCMIHLDNMRYMNHSDEPNTKTLNDNTMIAIQNIFCGEELFEDYREYSKYEYCVQFLQTS